MGIVLALVNFKTSYLQWTTTPVITTLDTISAHVSEIQFPTVTVCPYGGTLPNNWGYIQTLLDQMPYNCPRNGNEDCTEALKIKNKKFRFVFDGILQTVDKYLDNIGNKTLEDFIATILDHSEIAPPPIRNEKTDRMLPPAHGQSIVDLSKDDIWFIAKLITENDDRVFSVPKFGHQAEFFG